MSSFRVYIKPFDDSGSYVDDYIEVTQYVDAKALQPLSNRLDNDEYNVGVFKYSSMSLKLNNESGKFSDVDVFTSIFRYKRSSSLVRITWQQQDWGTQCGIAICGDEIAYEEKEVFIGLLSDESTSLEVSSQKLSFTVAGRESILSSEIVPFSSLTGSDTLEDIAYKCLNQPMVTQYFTVLSSNISLSFNEVPQSIAGMEDLTVKESIDAILEMGNGVLYIRNDILYITPRAATAEVQHTFYGQASNNGVEDIQNMSNIKTGLNKVFNLWTWEDVPSASRSDGTSIAKHGVRKKEIGHSYFTDLTDQRNILQSQLDEFKNLKQSLTITTPISYDKLDLFILDRISIDYPTVFYSAENAITPLYGVSKYSEARYPIGEWSIEIISDTGYKIIGFKIDFDKQLLLFELMEI